MKKIKKIKVLFNIFNEMLLSIEYTPIGNVNVSLKLTCVAALACFINDATLGDYLMNQNWALNKMNTSKNSTNQSTIRFFFGYFELNEGFLFEALIL